MQSSALRTSIENGIWLCQNCAKLIDSDESRYSPAILQRWKKLAENAALLEIERQTTFSLMPLPFNGNGFPYDEKDRSAIGNHQLRAFYRPHLSIYNRAIQTDSITIINLQNQGYLANSTAVVFPLVDRKIEKMIVNKNQLDTDEVLTITLVGNLVRPIVPIQISISLIDITGRIYQQEYLKLANHEKITDPALIDNINKISENAI
jgi:hypothetical protein